MILFYYYSIVIHFVVIFSLVYLFQEAEAQLEHEEARVLKVQLELTQHKQETERRFNDKDEEVESLRKNHQRQLGALQQSVEEETRLKNEQLKQKKLTEGERDELQNAIEEKEKVSKDCCSSSSLASKVGVAWGRG